MEIIFVCTGNTCRSPMAEAYLKSKKIKGLTVSSRGIQAFGERASANAVAVMNEYGIDLSTHISKTLSPEDLSADLLLCMTRSHANALEFIGADREKIKVLANDIPDPYGMDLASYRECFSSIADAVDEKLYDGTILDFKISAATSDDAEALAYIEAQSFSEPWSKNAFLESIDSGTYFFKAEKDNKIIGYIGISAIAGEGYITNIAVLEEYKGLGVGILLLNRVVSLARILRLEFVSLEVRASNLAAISLYDKLGFIREGIRKGFYSSPKEDAIIMTRRFKTNENTQY